MDGALLDDVGGHVHGMKARRHQIGAYEVSQFCSEIKHKATDRFDSGCPAESFLRLMMKGCMADWVARLSINRYLISG